MESVYKFLFITLQLVAADLFLYYIFEKIKEKPWKGLIPIYNIYILCKKLWSKEMFNLFFVATVVIIIDSITLAIGTTSSFALLMIYSSIIVSCIIYITMYLYLMQLICINFGKEEIFYLGLIFLPVIFLGILAFGDSKFTEEEIKKPKRRKRKTTQRKNIKKSSKKTKTTKK